MPREPKVYKPGDRYSGYLGRKTPKAVLEWLNMQSDLSESLVKAIANQIRTQGMTDISGVDDLETFGIAAPPRAATPPSPASRPSLESTKAAAVPSTPAAAAIASAAEEETASAISDGAASTLPRPTGEDEESGKASGAWGGLKDVGDGELF